MTEISPTALQGVLPDELQQCRDQWQTAYRQRDIATLSRIETSEFFVVFYQTVEKKADWHTTVASISQEDDPLLRLNAAKKVRFDNINEHTTIITSFFKSSTESCLIKEMWVKQKDSWQIASLALSKT